MIKELIISNYRSLGKDIHLRPGCLSVLIGPNGSGKSNTLDVLSFVRDALSLGLSAAITNRGGIDSVRRHSRGRPFDVQVRLILELDSRETEYEFVITGDRLEEYRIESEMVLVRDQGRETHLLYRYGDTWRAPEGLSPRMDEQSLALTALGGDERFKGLVDFLSRLAVYSVFPDTLREPQRFDPARPMKRHGENWVSVLRGLVKDEAAKEDLMAALGKLTGDIEDVRVTSAAGYLVAQFKQRAKAERGRRWFDASQQSDGTLRVAGLLTALLQSPPLPVVGVEEPELTVHPGVLPMVYDYLRQASEVSQVIVTTHSPIILDIVDVEKDAIFVVDRIDEQTQIKPVSGSQLEPVRKRLLSLGDFFLSGDLQLSLFGPQ